MASGRVLPRARPRAIPGQEHRNPCMYPWMYAPITVTPWGWHLRREGEREKGDQQQNPAYRSPSGVTLAGEGLTSIRTPHTVPCTLNVTPVTVTFGGGYHGGKRIGNHTLILPCCKTVIRFQQKNTWVSRKPDRTRENKSDMYLSDNGWRAVDFRSICFDAQCWRCAWCKKTGMSSGGFPWQRCNAFFFPQKKSKSVPRNSDSHHWTVFPNLVNFFSVIFLLRVTLWFGQPKKNPKN